jgi:hypothetical protein
MSRPSSSSRTHDAKAATNAGSATSSRRNCTEPRSPFAQSAAVAPSPRASSRAVSTTARPCSASRAASACRSRGSLVLVQLLARSVAAAAGRRCVARSGRDRFFQWWQYCISISSSQLSHVHHDFSNFQYFRLNYFKIYFIDNKF